MLKLHDYLEFTQAWSPYSRKNCKTCLRLCSKEGFQAFKISSANISCEGPTFGIITTIWRLIHSWTVGKHVPAILTTYMETRFYFTFRRNVRRPFKCTLSDLYTANIRNVMRIFQFRVLILKRTLVMFLGEGCLLDEVPYSIEAIQYPYIIV